MSHRIDLTLVMVFLLSCLAFARPDGYAEIQTLKSDQQQRLRSLEQHLAAHKLSELDILLEVEAMIKLYHQIDQTLVAPSPNIHNAGQQARQHASTSAHLNYLRSFQTKLLAESGLGGP